MIVNGKHLMKQLQNENVPDVDLLQTFLSALLSNAAALS
jgi:hypothetical protein